LRSDRGYLTYNITTSRMTSGELLKYRNGLLMPSKLTQLRTAPRDGPRNCSDSAPNAVVRFFDTGHFALETHTAEIASAIRDFLPD
jgi:hypothetical protein